MLGRVIQGVLRCVDGENPVPGTTGWNIRTGQTYSRTGAYQAEDGTVWLKILGDDGNLGHYRADCFEEVKG